MGYEFPQRRTSNQGRRIIVDRSEQDEDVLVFIYKDEEIAELHPPDEGAARRTDGMVEWRLTFEAYPETTVLGTADDPPLDAALFYVDQALDYLEEDE